MKKQSAVKKQAVGNGVTVFAGSKLAGRLSRADTEDSLLFTYREGCPAESAVSLTMPVSGEAYDSIGGLLPIFEMNLPEGLLRARLRREFSKAIPHFDDLDLLSIVGGSQIGRLHYSSTERLSVEVPEQSVTELLRYRGAEDLFEDLLHRYARHSGISGMQPKVLLRDESTNAVPARLTHAGATHIVKAFDPHEYPELALNEYLCTQGARASGIVTAATRLAETRKILVVDRFDRLPNGKYLGIEDFCVLDARRAHGRYDGSYERIAKRIGQFVCAEHQHEALEQFVLMVAYACAIENGDAHLKNFGVLYAHPESKVTLAPAYDLVCTTLYAPRDTLALTLNESKKFPEYESLLT